MICVSADTALPFAVPWSREPIGAYPPVGFRFLRPVARYAGHRGAPTGRCATIADDHVDSEPGEFMGVELSEELDGAWHSARLELTNSGRSQHELPHCGHPLAVDAGRQ